MNLIDTHFHIGPDFVKRKYDIISLANELKTTGMGVVIKNHCMATTALAGLARKIYNVNIYGSVVLNYFVGGLNKEAIIGAMGINKSETNVADPDKKRFVVWMPTVHAAAHIESIGWDFDPIWGIDEKYCTKKGDIVGITILKNGQLVPEVNEILKTIKEFDLVLATGHLGNEETVKLVEEASKMGIKRIIVTHPVYKSTELTLDQQKYLSGLGAYIEHTYGVNLIDKIPISSYLDAIRAVGVNKCIISTDLGQMHTPGLNDGFNEFINKLLEAGLTQEEIEIMGYKNPFKLLEGSF